MESNLTFSSLIALFGAMLVLASIPSTSVLVVSTRSVTSGFRHGALTAAGIVAGDMIFIVLAIGGLSVLAEMMSTLFVIVKYLGGAYLIGLGTTLWRSTPTTVEIEDIAESSLLVSFLTGLFITLGDLKAILFYLGFFPAFLDLANISMLDISLIVIVTAVTVGGVKLGYAFIADKTRLLFRRSGPKKVINRTAGSVMIGVGVFLVAKN
ncbi:MAG: LysE family translocator [Anaerolineae bacterium]|nr:LysE family translocator [Anaerolineae bacterium]